MLKKAIVTAYCGKAADNDKLGSDPATKDDGSYSITFSKACAKPVELVVTVTVGTTKMVDEISGGDVDPVAGFTMSAVAPSVSGSVVTQHITPFTHMAAAVAKAASTFDSGTVKSAEQAIVKTVLGSNPNLYSATPKNARSIDPDEQQLLSLLTSIAAKASKDGVNVKSTLDNLVAQALASVSATATDYTIKSGVSNTPAKIIQDGADAIFGGTVTLPTASPVIKDDVNGVKIAVITPAVTASTPTTTQPPTTVTQNTGIDSVRKLLTALRSNVLSITNNQKTGFIDTQAKAMVADAANYHGTAQFNFRQLTRAMVHGADFLRDAAKNNISAANADGPFTETAGTFYRRRWGYQYSSNGGTGAASGYNYASSDAMVCYYFTRSSTGAGITNGAGVAVRPAPTPGTASCSYTPDNYKTQVHMVISSSNAGDANPTFSYANSITTWNNLVTNWSGTRPACSAPEYFNANCDISESSKYEGTYAASADATGTVVGFILNSGKLIPWATGSADTTASLNVSYAQAANGDETVNLTGSLASGGVTLLLNPGSKGTYLAASKIETLTLVTQLKTALFQYDGTFEEEATKNATAAGCDAPNKGSFIGKISSLSNGVATALFEGNLTMAVKNFCTGMSTYGKSSFDFKVFDAKVSHLSGDIDAGYSTAGTESLSTTYAFTDNYSLSISATGSMNDISKLGTMTITGNDGTKFELTKNDSYQPISGYGHGVTGVVKDGAGATIGNIRPGLNQVNFTDGTYFLLL